MKNDSFIITCEHGGNRIPSRYRSLFDGHEALLPTHRGYDAGALRLAREMAGALHAPLYVSTVSRLLIDLNRSLIHPQLYSEATRKASKAVQQEIWQRYYLPYRTKIETQIRQAIGCSDRVIHVSCHSFTPELDGKVRDADIGLLYDPGRPHERDACHRWRASLKELDGSLRVRLNYPYAGKSDGITSAMRRRFSADRYVGIEVEINQRHVLESARHWRDVRRIVIDGFELAMAPEYA
ncbi:MAG: N-formylglutamate amidohydrolase [Herminiimonas sp.]|nr:N-formylglutamate amidohydrolase [Herminiimonas sp.]